MPSTNMMKAVKQRSLQVQTQLTTNGDGAKCKFSSKATKFQTFLTFATNNINNVN